MTPHQKLIAAIDALIDQRCTDPLAAIPVITTKEFLKLTAPPAPRLLAAGLRRGYPKTTAITLDSDPWTTY